MSTPVGILGFSGYSGIELLDILKRHCHVEPILLEHRETVTTP
jgi:N-acetyl-gamma-glutamylphosphate reductase